MSQREEDHPSPLTHGPLPLDAQENFHEVRRCALCNSEDRRLRFRDDPFSVLECLRCGLVYVTPRLKPEVLPRVYGADYWKSENPSWRGYADYAHAAPLYLKTFEKRARFVERFVSNRGRVLDVGCAAGFFMQVMHQRGWEVAGVELSPEIAAHAKETYGFHQLHVGELHTAPFAEGSFDLITLWDFIEHVPDPIALLRRATSLLRDDGRLVVETQNVASGFARLLGRRWQHYKHLEHLYHFHPKTLAALFDQSGLEMMHHTWRYGGKYVSLEFVRERAKRLHPSLSRLLRHLASLDRLSAYVNPGDEMIAVARKARAADVPTG